MIFCSKPSHASLVRLDVSLAGTTARRGRGGSRRQLVGRNKTNPARAVANDSLPLLAAYDYALAPVKHYGPQGIQQLGLGPALSIS